MDDLIVGRTMLAHRMGRSPTRGYEVRRSGSDSFLIQELRTSGYVRTGILRIPKDQEDAVRLAELILRAAFGGAISAQAALVAIAEGKDVP